MEVIIDNMVSFLDQYLSPELVAFLVSMLPIVELRGGIIAAYALGINWLPALLICTVGNMLPIPFVLLFGRKLVDWMKKFKLFHRIAKRMENKAKEHSMKKFKLLGLFIFVAIPLPGTGAWTGAFVASILNLRMKDALLAITAGVLTAGLIMLIFSFGLLHSIGIG